MFLFDSASRILNSEKLHVLAVISYLPLGVQILNKSHRFNLSTSCFLSLMLLIYLSARVYQRYFCPRSSDFDEYVIAVVQQRSEMFLEINIR